MTHSFRPTAGGSRVLALSLIALALALTRVGADGAHTDTFAVASALDDVNEDGGVVEPFGGSVWFGTGGSPDGSFTGLRFVNVDVPRGATITSAHLEVRSAATGWISIGLEFGIEATGDAAGFGISPPSARVLAAPRVAHASNVQWAAGTWHTFDGLAPLVQAVVNRADWVGGNSLALIARGTLGQYGRQFATSFDADGLSAARLVITHEGGEDPPPPPPPTVGFQVDPFVAGVTYPTSTAFTPDGRLLITERLGTMRIVLPGRDVVEPTPALALTNIEAIVGERSLIAVTVDPEFASNGHYYVFYTAATPLRDRVSRFTMAGNATDLATEVVIWEDVKPSSDIHHGGGLVFGRDGKLFISVGDGHDTRPESEHASQRLTEYGGKVLRVNRDGSIPADNPFHDGDGPNLDAIWALGLRNPFRMSFDAATNRLFAFDVGGGQFEEINLIEPGRNYGWPTCEGVCPNEGMTSPYFAYPHGGTDAAIGGGVIVRGSQFPDEYRGNLFYGDFVRGWLRRLVLDTNGGVSSDVAFMPDPATPAPEDIGSVVHVTEGPDGALYVTDIGGSTIRRIWYYTDNAPPAITTVAATPQTGPTAPLTVQFTGAATDPEGQPLTYTWEFGDGAMATGATTTHEYTATGSFSARLVVSDGVNETFSSPIAISVGGAPTATITSPADGSTFVAGQRIDFAGVGTDPGATLTPAAYSWRVIFHHDTHEHPAYGPVSGTTSGSFTIPTSGHDFGDETSYEIELTITDAEGLEAVASVTVLPQKVNFTVSSDPAGVPLGIDERTLPAPHTRDTLVGFQHLVTAPLTFDLGGTMYEFVSWSDGGAAAHTATVPDADSTLVATYRQATGSGTQVLTLQVSSGADDVNEVSGALDMSSGTVWAGTGGSSTASYTGLRFAEVLIPKGSYIQSAVLELRAAQTNWISIGFETGLDASPDAAPFSAATRPSVRALAAPRVAHASDALWQAGTWYAVQDLTALVQMAIDAPGWNPGQALALVMRGTNGTWGRQFARSFDADAASAPRLVVTYTGEAPPPPPPPPPPPTGQVTVTYQVSTAEDDANEVDGNLQAASALWLGTGGSANGSFAALRFAGVTIPAGMEVVSARLEVHAMQTQWISMGVEAALEDTGNSAGFTTGLLPSQRILTSERHHFDENSQWVANTWYPVVDVAAALQAVVGRPDWAYGQAFTVILRGTNGTWGRKFIDSVDTSASLAPRLVVTFRPKP